MNLSADLREVWKRLAATPKIEIHPFRGFSRVASVNKERKEIVLDAVPDFVVKVGDFIFLRESAMQGCKL